MLPVKKSFRRWHLFTLLLAGFFIFSPLGGCRQGDSLESHLKEITSPYRFSILKWEAGAIISEAGKLWRHRSGTAENGTGVVAAYFESMALLNKLEMEIAEARSTGTTEELKTLEEERERIRQTRAGLVAAVERNLETQIGQVLAEEGIHNPLLKLKVKFPPVKFILGDPPHLLVVSPRERIERMKETILVPDLTLKEKESIENQVDAYGVSSIVVELGGIATFPAFVSGDADLRFAIETAIEEWLHQYLAFTPLGFRYLLHIAGIWRSEDIALMNETVAGIVSEEIAGQLIQKYYPQYASEPSPEETERADFFNSTMRQIRLKVDELLEQGRVAEAEDYMERQRQYLIEHDFYIRKLNQAYFAFHGTYGDSPASVSPLGEAIMKVRERSASVKEFLDTMAAMTGAAGLLASRK